jgi:hypothetical protein
LSLQQHPGTKVPLILATSPYWPACERYLTAAGKTNKDGGLYANFDDLFRRLSKQGAQLHGGLPTTEQQMSDFRDEERAVATGSE